MYFFLCFKFYFYLFTFSSSYFYGKITDQRAQDVLRMILKAGRCSLVLSHCQHQQVYLEIVRTKQAKYLFVKKECMRAAVFSETQRSFEEVCLRFNENEPLL